MVCFVRKRCSVMIQNGWVHGVRPYGCLLYTSVPGTLKNYEEKLVGRAFARCNSGYLVNLAQVSGVQQDMVQVGPYALQISRPRRKAFMAELADYIGGAGQ